MAGAIASLVVRLGLDAAEFVTGLERSDREAKKFAASMERDAKKIGAALGIHISAGVTALFLMTKSAIDAADKLNDLSKSTGISAETLGGLGFAAKQSGTDLEGVAASVGKLNLKIASAVAGNKEARQSFELIGVSMKQLRESSPDQVLQKIATAFAGYEDGPNKAALANVYFGKSYQSMIPLLNEGGAKLKQQIDYFKRYGGVTDEVVAQADEFNDTLSKLGLLSGAFARNLASALLPSLQGVANHFVTAKEKGDGFKSTAETLADSLKALAGYAVHVAFAFEKVGTGIGGMAAKAKMLATLDISGYQAIRAAEAEDRDRMRADRDALLAAIRNPTASLGAGSVGGGPKRQAPGLPDTGAKSEADAIRKALLDANLKAIDRAIKQEEELLKDREHFLTQYYQDDVIGIKQYYAQLQSGRDDFIVKERAAFAEKEALLKAFRPKDEKDRIANDEKLLEIRDKLTKAEREYFNASVDGTLAQARATKQFNESLDQLAVSLKAARGDTVGAGLAGFDLQYADLRRKMQAEGRSTTDIDALRRITDNQLRLTKAAQEYNLTLDELGIAQRRISNAQEAGSLSELGALRARSEVTTSYIAKLKEELAAVEAIAIASGKREDAVRVAQLRVELEGLAATGDLVAKKFNDQIGIAFADNLTAVLDRTKSLKQGFEDLGKSISRMLNQVIADELKTYLFGGKGALSGAGGMLSSLFSGGSSANAGSWLASLFSAGDSSMGGTYGYASGTNYARGGWAMVGERGPEIINVPRGAQVIPNHELRARRDAKAGSVTTINVNVLPGATKESVAQAANEQTRRQLQAARNR